MCWLRPCCSAVPGEVKKKSRMSMYAGYQTIIPVPLPLYSLVWLLLLLVVWCGGGAAVVVAAAATGGGGDVVLLLSLVVLLLFLSLVVW